MSHLGNLAVGAVAVFALACTDQPGEPITSPIASPIKSAATHTSAVTTAEPGAIRGQAYTDAQATFHAKNYADWVGKAHNKALDDFFALTIAQKGAPKNLCARILEFMSDPARLPADKVHVTRAQQRSYALAALSRTQTCEGQLADNGSSGLRLVNAMRSTSSSASWSELSVAANSLIDQINSAQTAATTASGLATALTPILSQADQLVGSERDVVYSVASVAQSSFEYWLANLQPQADQVQATYGGCLVLYADEPYALNTCMGVTGPPALIEPTSYRNSDNSSHFLYAASRLAGCDDRLSKTNVVLWDVSGAVGGALLGWLAGPPGIFTAAVSGAAVASIGESTYQIAGWAWCKVQGGVKSGPQTT